MSKAGAVLEEVKKAVVGKDEVLVQVLLAILAGGHILLEDIPGVGKTTMALAFSRALALEYNRVQFTPDVLPSDITGFSLYNKHTGAMEYQPGAVLCNLFLADELNRATSRTPLWWWPRKTRPVPRAHSFCRILSWTALW